MKWGSFGKERTSLFPRNRIREVNYKKVGYGLKGRPERHEDFGQMKRWGSVFETF